MEYEIRTLKEIDMNFEFFKEYNLTFLANNNKLEGYIDGKLMIEVEDNDNYFEDGMIGLMVENGEFSYPVSEITIAGNLNNIYKNISLANDLEFNYSTNSPTMLVEGMIVGGK